MDIVSVDEIIVSDASVQDNVNTSHENEALEIQAGAEITHGHKLIGSQSSIEYDKSGDSKRRGTGPRSKSFLEEPSRSKAALFMQRKPGGKELRSTHGSHGDGICLWPSWDINKGLIGSESTDKGSEQEKKSQETNLGRAAFIPMVQVRVETLQAIVLTDQTTQAGGVTQKLFEANVTFADLVRVYTTQENNIQNCKFQLGNTLLSTVHASTLVSNYLNTYRSYLDYLRKTCGRGNSQEKLISPRAPPKSAPLFLPLAGMTSVFSDDSREDPEFLELLKKTTTESIRKLWPHTNRSNIVCNADLIDARENEDEESVPETDTITDRPTDSVSSETYTETPSQQFVDTSEYESTQCSNDKSHLSENVKLCQYSYVFDSPFKLAEDSNVSTNNPNYAMKFTSDTVLIGDGDSANVQNMNSTKVQKGLLKSPNDTQTSVNSIYKHTGEPVCQQSSTSGLSSWCDLSQQKYASDSSTQLHKPATLDTLLQQQQKLAQQQQLQRQMLQHQQELQQHRQQQQLLQQYQQQEQQRQQAEQQLSASKSHGFQPNPDTSKSWLQAVGEGTGLNSYRTCLSINSQPTSSYKTEPLMSHQIGLDPYGNSYQMNADYFSSHTGHSMATRPTHMDSQPSSFPETSTHARTLKASYACLDPSNPMTLSVDPLHDYNNEPDAFLNQCDMPMYDRQPFSNLPSSLGPSFEERDNFDPSRMWGKVSRPISSFNDSENSGKSLEERLRKAYVQSRVSQFPQQSQWNDASRLSIQRPVVKMSSMADSNDESQSYAFQGQRPISESGNRRAPSAATNSASPQDRWNRLVSCPETVDTNGHDGLMSSSSGQRGDEGVSFMPLQSSTTSLDPNLGMSRLFQWKQGIPTTNKANYCTASRPQNDISGFTPNDNAAHSLLYGLQLDRDFSWNASSMSSQLPSITAQNSLFQCSDHQDLTSDGGQSKLCASNLSKLIVLTAEQRRQLSNNNNATALLRRQNEQVNDSSLFYDMGETKHNAWSVKSKQDDPDDQGVSGNNSLGCGPVLSPSMQILNKKILAAQGNPKSHIHEGSLGNSGSDGDSPNGKEGEKTRSGTSTPSSIDSQSTDNRSRLRLSRAYSEAGTMLPHSNIAMSQLTSMHQHQQGRQTVDNSVFKLSDELEKTFLDDHPNSTPWHELASQESLDNEFNLDDTNSDKDKYGSMHSFKTTSMTLSDQEMGTLRSNNIRMYDCQHKPKDQCLQSALGNHMSNSQMCSNQQGPSPPRMILGAKSVKLANEDKLKVDVEESNRRLRQMLGLAPNKDKCGNVNISGMRLQESSQMPPQTPSPGLMLMDQNSGPYNQSHSPVATGQMTRMQVAGGKIQTPVGMAQQMYCVPNILMPPPSVQSQSSSRQSNMVPIQGVVTSMASGTRFPQGLIRVPFVDMSRLVYVHQMPINMTSTHPNNNNHNNSSSSNPHVNTSNIITINTSDNDFSAGGQGDKSARHIRSTPGKSKTTFLKMRSGSKEFAVPILGIRPPLDENICPRLVKSRTNPWDQDLDHDFSNSLMSKTVSLENMTTGCATSSAADPNFGNPELGLLYSDGTNPHGVSQPSLDQTGKSATFMQWPASADMHPEMLDMLPIRRATPEDCGSGRLCWPEMEFLMSSRDQLQTARRSNKPMGSNKANLISIIPKENITDGSMGVKETRFEKLENKLT